MMEANNYEQIIKNLEDRITGLEKAQKEAQDREEIIQNQLKYAWCIDTLDFETFKSCFADNFIFDFSHRDPTMVGPCTPDEIAKRFKNVVSGYVATQHLMSNFKIDINGDRAMCRCYLKGFHYLPNLNGDSWSECISYYTNEYARIDGRWKIVNIKINHMAWYGNYDANTQAGLNVKNGTCPKRPDYSYKDIMAE